MPCYTSTVVDITDSEVVLDLIRIDDAVFIAEEAIGWRPDLDDWSRAISKAGGVKGRQLGPIAFDCTGPSPFFDRPFWRA